MGDKGWAFAQEALRTGSLLIFGCFIYKSFEADKDLLLVFLFTLASGSITGGMDLLKKKFGAGDPKE